MVKVKDALGDRMKEQESSSTSRKAIRGQPLLVRLDGRSFHTFCRGLEKPYSEDFLTCMEVTMEWLVAEFHCKVGYTQSDEITLGWVAVHDTATQWPFGGRFQKLESVLASFAGVAFYKAVQEHLPQKAKYTPCFDARAWQPPTLVEAANAFLWRQRDCLKNAISMVAQSQYSHKQLHGKTTGEIVALLEDDAGIRFSTAYPPRFQRGVFAKRTVVEKHLSGVELLCIPEKHRPTGPVMRTVIDYMDLDLDGLSLAGPGGKEKALFGQAELFLASDVDTVGARS